MLRKIIEAIVCLSLVMGTVSCNKALTEDIRTQAEADPRVDFSGMKTYAWAGALTVVNDPERLWSDVNLDVGAELKHLIDNEMRVRGWNEASKPDMEIAFLVVNDVQELKAIEAERAGEVPDLVGVGEGALVIEIVDAITGQTIWIGAATANTQTGRATEDVKSRLKYVVKRLFADIPK